MSDDEKVCSICLDEIINKFFTSTLDCGHMFHSNCINTYIIKSKKNKCSCSCPNCRKPIINTEDVVEDDCEDEWEEEYEDEWEDEYEYEDDDEWEYEDQEKHEEEIIEYLLSTRFRCDTF